MLWWHLRGHKTNPTASIAPSPLPALEAICVARVGKRSKLNAHVDFPLEGLNMAPYMESAFVGGEEHNVTVPDCPTAAQAKASNQQNDALFARFVATNQHGQPTDASYFRGQQSSSDTREAASTAWGQLSVKPAAHVTHVDPHEKSQNGEPLSSSKSMSSHSHRGKPSYRRSDLLRLGWSCCASWPRCWQWSLCRVRAP